MWKVSSRVAVCASVRWHLRPHFYVRAACNPPKVRGLLYLGGLLEVSCAVS